MIVVGIVEISNFPLTYLMFKMGFNPLAAYYVYFAVYLVLMFLRLFLIKNLIRMKAKAYMQEVYLKVLLVTFASLIAPSIIYLLQPDSILRFIEICIVSSISTLFMVFYLGITPNEREAMICFIKSKINNK